MSISMMVSTGIAIAASVGPAREWRGLLAGLDPDIPVDRSQVYRTEQGVPGLIMPQSHFESVGLIKNNMGPLGTSILHGIRVHRVSRQQWMAPSVKPPTMTPLLFSTPGFSQVSTSGPGPSGSVLTPSVAPAAPAVAPGADANTEFEAMWPILKRELEPVRTPRSSGCSSGRCCIAAPVVDMELPPSAISADLTRDEKEESAQVRLMKLAGVDRFIEYVSRNETEIGTEYLRTYVMEHNEDGRALAVLGMHQLLVRRDDLALPNLARAASLGAATFATPIDLASVGVSPTKLAAAVTRLMSQKFHTRSGSDAQAIAVAAYLSGNRLAAKKLLDQAISSGMDVTEAANLTGLWKIAHKSAQ